MQSRSPEEWHSWVAEFSQGANEEAWRGIMCFLRWIAIREENGHAVPNFLNALEGDIFHSFLLRRMLEGREPLKLPPPENFGKPWYELVEAGSATVQDVGPWEWAPEERIVINGGIWNIQQKLSATEMLVVWKPGSEVFRLTKREAGWSIVREK